MADELTHVDAAGAARMVDVSGKQQSLRTAIASGRVRTTPAVLQALRDNTIAKGDAIGVARVAGIMAAKRTQELIPLCHHIAISGVTVDFSLTDSEV